MSKINPLAGLLLLLLLAACSLLSPTDVNPAEPTAPNPTITSPIPTNTPDGLPKQQTPTPGPLTLTIWVPPHMDPYSSTQAGTVLKERIDAYNLNNPEVNVEVRVKAEDGPGGMLDSLSTSNAAAPLALPDLIALPYDTMQEAARLGLLRPFDGLTTVMTDEDWYSYAQEMSFLNNSTYGLPFAGDVQILTYRPSLIQDPPTNWATTLSTGATYAFPAADLQAVFTLLSYQANGGPIQDPEGQPTLDQEILTEVLSFYQQAEEIEVMPFWLTQFQSDNQAWESFQDSRTNMIVNWLSSTLKNAEPDSDITRVITPEGNLYTLADGWVWALSNKDPEHQQHSADLAEFLVESSFLAEWTEALGYLPPRPSALLDWSNIMIKYQLDRISSLAHILPATDILNRLGPILEKATVDVLKQQSSPAGAAQTAVESLAGP